MTAPLLPPAVLLTIGIAAIAGLLLLIMVFRLHPFVALLLVATLAALAGGTRVHDLVRVVEGGIGGTLGHVATIITFGAMIGRMIDLSGGAEALAGGLVHRFGERRVPMALAMAAFGVAIPVFFEVAVVMLMPLAYRLARTDGLGLIRLSIPMCAVMLVVHAMLPPHPGAVAVASELHADLGRMLMFGLPVAAVTAVVVFLAAKPLLRGPFTLAPEIAALIDQAASAPERGYGVPAAADPLCAGAGPPGIGLVVALVVLPVLLILIGTVATFAMDPRSGVRAVLAFLGIPYVALLIDVLLCAWLLGLRRGATFATVSDVLGAALPPIAIIILITGAGGAFAGVLVSTGIGPALAAGLRSTGLPVLVLGFLVTMLLRAAQGPTTVALMTTAGIVAPLVHAAGYPPNRLALVALAMGAGGMALSHVNDAGFWIVTRMSGLSVADGLRTWTVLTTVSGFTALLLILAIWTLV